MLFDNSTVAYIDDVTGVYGDVTGVYGDVTGVYGDVTGVYGDVTGVYDNAFGFNILKHGFTGKNVAASGFRSHVIKDGYTMLY